MINTQSEVSRTRMAQVLKLLRESPDGLEPKDLPMNRRCYLRPLEKDGKIEYKNGRWRAVQVSAE